MLLKLNKNLSFDVIALDIVYLPKLFLDNAEGLASLHFYAFCLKALELGVYNWLDLLFVIHTREHLILFQSTGVSTKVQEIIRFNRTPPTPLIRLTLGR